MCTFVLARYLETTNACALLSLQNFIVKNGWRTYGRLFSCTSLAISHYQFIILRLFVSSVMGLKAFFHSQVSRFFKKFTFWRSSIYAHTSSPSFAYPGFRVRLNVFFFSIFSHLYLSLKAGYLFAPILLRLRIQCLN